MKKGQDWLVGLYRSGVLAGISAIIWWQMHFVSVERFADYRESHEKLTAEVIDHIHKDISDVKDTTRRLETKVDILLREHKQVMAIQKKMLEDHYE